MKTTKKKAAPKRLPADYLAGTVATREAAHAPPPAAAPAAEPPDREKMTYYLPTALLRELRAASAELGGPPVYCHGPSQLVQQALTAHLAALAKQHNKGKPFVETARTTQVRRGRPPKRG